MRIISRKALRRFRQKREHSDAEQPLGAWYREASKAAWSSPFEIKAMYASVSLVWNSRVVLNIVGNKYRLVVKVSYHYRVMYIRFIGTHRLYDQMDVTEI